MKEEEKKPKNRRRKTGRIVAIAIALCLLAGGITTLVIVLNTSHTGPEAMDSLARKYFDDKIADSPQKSTSYTLVIKNLKLLGYDTSDVETFGCSVDSYATIFLNPSTGQINEITTNMVGC